CAAVGPFCQEVVLDEPDAIKPHLLGEPHLIDNLPYALMLCLRWGRSGNLYLIEQTEFHAVFPLSEVHNGHADASHRGARWAMPLRDILEKVAIDSNLYDNMVVGLGRDMRNTVQCSISSSMRSSSRPK